MIALVPIMVGAAYDHIVHGDPTGKTIVPIIVMAMLAFLAVQRRRDLLRFPKLGENQSSGAWGPTYADPFSACKRRLGSAEAIEDRFGRISRRGVRDDSAKAPLHLQTDTVGVGDATVLEFDGKETVDDDCHLLRCDRAR